jgi:hypothetical protein
MSNAQLIDDILRTGLARTLANPTRIRLDKLLGTLLDNAGNLRPGAVGLAILLTRDAEIPGTAAVGTNVAPPKRMPQAGRIVRLDALARTAPSGGEFTARCYADGEEVGTVSIANGSTAGGSAVTYLASAGDVLTWDVLAANGAAGVTLTASYRTT